MTDRHINAVLQRIRHHRVRIFDEVAAVRTRCLGAHIDRDC